jgi:hypothetical protein
MTLVCLLRHVPLLELFLLGFFHSLPCVCSTERLDPGLYSRKRLVEAVFQFTH